ncbi:uncharacterized protein LOC143205327 [Rhynchophorus ferrugineus]|uniref:uncharacterized protein LOC143205327 n=1 Tax=Rhynchophorus ferrugineus TaxID=354439 RepID=UPI003FCD917B
MKVVSEVIIMALSYTVVFVSFFIAQVMGHGYMVSPINRASRWRLDITNYDIPHNYEDNQFFCGGYSVQYNVNGGKCGPCGDNWNDTVPRSNENGGLYGQGVVVAEYVSGDIIEVHVLITANHKGKISYQLCNLEHPDLPEEDDCFEDLWLEDGNLTQSIHPDDYAVVSYVKLPDEFVCDRCVLRWHYSAGNNWGVCEDGTQAVGCGPQETFRSCADIAIRPLFNKEWVSE